MLGPVLFTFYTCPAGNIIRRHDLRFQLYADDTQVYIRFIIGDWQEQVAVVHKVKHCLAEIRDWMERNYLKMNDDKTIAVVATPPRHSNRGISHQAGRVRRDSFTQCQKHWSGVRQRDVDWSSK